MGHRDPSSLNRFFTRSPWPTGEVERRRLQMALRRVRGRGYLIWDDTLLHKTGKKIPGAAHLYDASEGRSVWAQQIVTTHFSGNLRFPVGWRQYLPRSVTPKPRSKIELVKEQVQEAIEQGVPFDDGLFDSWYFCRELTRFLEERGKGWVSEAPINRAIMIGNRRTRIGSWANHIPRSLFRRVRVEGKTYQTFTKTVRMVKQGWVRACVCYEEGAGQEEPKILVSNHLEWEAKRALEAHARRWDIEAFYRDAKQNLGLEGCQLRDAQGTSRYIVACLVADTLLSLQATPRAIVEGLDAAGATLGDRCALAQVEVLRDFVRWVVRQHRERGVGKITRLALASRAEAGAMG